MGCVDFSFPNLAPGLDGAFPGAGENQLVLPGSRYSLVWRPVGSVCFQAWRLARPISRSQTLTLRFSYPISVGDQRFRTIGQPPRNGIPMAASYI
ncbi:MAG: hypothetical protein CBB71_15880 [Rhodopirellula sp. TMED11]|nr:MAG: hypothetical protein CBB71_15880 [Rhodopirellula sp. TMED11]